MKSTINNHPGRASALKGFGEFPKHPAGEVVFNPQNTTMKKIAKWITLHEKNLRSLFADYRRDSKDKNMPFIAFAYHMYAECKH